LIGSREDEGVSSDVKGKGELLSVLGKETINARWENIFASRRRPRRCDIKRGGDMPWESKEKRPVTFCVRVNSGRKKV